MTQDIETLREINFRNYCRLVTALERDKQARIQEKREQAEKQRIAEMDAEIARLYRQIPETVLICSNNRLTRLPPILERLSPVICSANELDWTAQLNRVRTQSSLYKFQMLYFSLKFKPHFIKWLWKSREQKIRAKYSPEQLANLLEEIGECEEDQFDRAIDNW